MADENQAPKPSNNGHDSNGHGSINGKGPINGHDPLNAKKAPTKKKTPPKDKPAGDGQSKHGPSKHIGRPRSLTPEKKQQVLAFLAGGGSRRKAAAYVGISLTTIADEAKRDEQFSDDLSRAEASSYFRHLQNVSKAGEKDWRASAFLLERKWPEEFGKTQTVNVAAQEPPMPIVEVTVRTHDDAKRFRELSEIEGKFLTHDQHAIE
jgi:hypothetical protein